MPLAHLHTGSCVSAGYLSHTRSGISRQAAHATPLLGVAVQFQGCLRRGVGHRLVDAGAPRVGYSISSFCSFPPSTREGPPALCQWCGPLCPTAPQDGRPVSPPPAWPVCMPFLLCASVQMPCRSAVSARQITMMSVALMGALPPSKVSSRWPTGATVRQQNIA